MAEQYSWLDASGKGYSAGQYSGEAGKLRKWSRGTVADGKWLNRETIEPFSGRDQYLLDSLNQTYDECSAFSGDLQYQIDVIEARADVVDVVGSYEDFVNKYSAGYVPGIVSDNDVVKILNDETSAHSQTYYRWHSADNPATGTWTGVGSLEPSYNNANISNGILTVNNTNTERNYTLSGEKYIELNGNSKTGAFGLTNEFISSASQCYTALSTTSGNWNSVYDTVCANSANWSEASAVLSEYSANWQATYSAVSSNSASWNETAYVPLSAQECLIGSGNTVISRSQNNNIVFIQGRDNSADECSFAQGWYNSASINSLAQGYKTSAYFDSFAAGSASTAKIASFAQGFKNYTYNLSFAQGQDNTGKNTSLTQGWQNSANDCSIAQGYDNRANNNSITQGSENTADNYSIAQGFRANATDYSIAQGYTVNSEDHSFGQGLEVTAKNKSFAQGRNNSADNNSFAAGYYNSAKNYSIAQGYKTSAYYYSFAQGYNVTAGKTIGCALAQGNDVYVEQNSFGQGSYINSTVNSFAQGVHCSANNGALAQGVNNSATGLSQTLGEGLRASNGMAIGKYNKTTNARFVIGNGIDNDNRSDLYWINNTGDVYTSGNISAKNFYINGNPIDSIVSAKFSAYNGSNTLLTAYPISSFGLYANTAKYINVSTANNRLDFSVADTLINSASSGYQAKQWINTNGDGIIGVSSTVYNNSAAWGETAYVPLSAIECKIGNANSANEISFAQGQGASAKTISFAQGQGTRAQTISFAQGLTSVAQEYSFAQGLTNSSNRSSFAQGVSNIANDYSIAQGVSSTALNYSQAFGAGTVITNTGMAIGWYNKTSADVAFVIGNGHDDTRRSDLYWIDHDGNVSAKGNISATNFYINGIPLNCTHTYTSGINANQDSYDIVKMNITDISAVQQIPQQQMQRTVQTLCLAVSANNTNKRYALWPEEFGENTAASHSDMYIPVFDVKTTAVKKTYIKTSDLNLGNYVSAAASQSITFQSAATIPSTLTNGIYYII